MIAGCEKRKILKMFYMNVYTTHDLKGIKSDIIIIICNYIKI